MHDNEIDGDDRRPTDPSEPEAQDIAREGLGAVEYLRLAEECLLVASLTKDPEKAAELIRTADEYLRRAGSWLTDRIKDH